MEWLETLTRKDDYGRTKAWILLKKIVMMIRYLSFNFTNICGAQTKIYSPHLTLLVLPLDHGVSVMESLKKSHSVTYLIEFGDHSNKFHQCTSNESAEFHKICQLRSDDKLMNFETEFLFNLMGYYHYIFHHYF